MTWLQSLPLNDGQWLFLAITLGASVLVTGVLIYVLRQPVRSQGIDRRLLNIAIYRERMAESAALGNVDEVRQRLLEDAEELNEPPARKSRLHGVLAVLVASLLLLSPLAIYLHDHESWRLMGATEDAPPVDYLLRQTRQRARANPEDADAWLLLARFERRLDHLRDAANAYGRANRLRNNDADALVEEGEVLAKLAGGNLLGRPLANFEAALKINPTHPRALLATGLAAYQQGNKTTALARWETLAQQPLPTEIQTLIRSKIEELGGHWRNPPAQPATQIALSVQLTQTLGQIKPGSVLFVYAKALDGPRQPLAVIRRELTNAQFPIDVTLTDDDNVMGGTKLSGYAKWRVVARISASGNAIPQPGDWMGEQIITREAAKKGRISLTIQQEMPTPTER